jgi:hypothetical protein
LRRPASAERRRGVPPWLRRLLRADRADPPLSSLLLAASLFAAAELAAGLLIGGFFAWGRAEALIFLFFRPWLLLLAALWTAPWSLSRRALFYILALILAGLAESLLLFALGGDPWLELARGLAAGMLAAALIDLVIQLGMRRGCLGQALATALVLLLLVTPAGQRPYEWVALGPTEPGTASSRPPLLLMSALPLIWGETGPFDPASRPAAAFSALEREFDIRPIDYLDEASLRHGRLMLLAQPRALAPAELVALDAWVRRGGRLMVLADPELSWPTSLPIGDARRAPPTSLLTPLLDHWGLALSPPDRRLALEMVGDGEADRLLALQTPGRWRTTGGACRVGPRDFLASCAIGAGRVRLVADADLLRDDLWASTAARGTQRHLRLSDNPLVVADWLDRLGGIDRERAEAPVRWQRPGANRGRALALAALPILGGFAAFALLRRRRR